MTSEKSSRMREDSFSSTASTISSTSSTRSSVSSQGTRLESWMYWQKEEGNQNSWMKLYAVLKGEFLLMYSNKNASGGPLFQIVVKSVSYQKTTNVFIIQDTNGDDIHVYLYDQNDIQEWMENLNLAAETCERTLHLLSKPTSSFAKQNINSEEDAKPAAEGSSPNESVHGTEVSMSSLSLDSATESINSQGSLSLTNDTLERHYKGTLRLYRQKLCAKKSLFRLTRDSSSRSRSSTSLVTVEKTPFKFNPFTPQFAQKLFHRKTHSRRSSSNSSKESSTQESHAQAA